METLQSPTEIGAAGAGSESDSDSEEYPRALVPTYKRVNTPSTIRDTEVASKRPKLSIPTKDTISTEVSVDQLEGDMAMQSASAGDKHNELASMVPHDYPKWRVFRMLIPACDDSVDRHDRQKIKNIEQNTGACITIQRSGSEVAVVTIYAKEDDKSSISSTTNIFLRVYQHFMHRNCPDDDDSWYTVRLLVPVAQASSLIAQNKLTTIWERWCSMKVYLTGSLSVLPLDYVCLRLLGPQEDLHEAIQSIASHLGIVQSRNPASEVQLDTSHMGTPPPNHDAEMSTSQQVHLTGIPLSYVAAIIGERGENIKRIREASQAMVTIDNMLEPDLVQITIRSSLVQIEVAEKMMQGYIASRFADAPSVFEHVFSGVIGRTRDF